MKLYIAPLLVSSSILVSATAVQPLPADKVRDVSPRQTDNLIGELLDLADSLGISGCIPESLPLITMLPAIPSGLIGADLISQGVSQTTLALSEVCDFSITGSVGTIFTSFLPTVYDWFSVHRSEIASVISKCTNAAKLTSTFDAYATCKGVTTTLPAGAGGSGTTSSKSGIQTATNISDTGLPLSTASPTTTASRTTTVPSSTTVSQNVAPRETGVMMAVAAAAGFIGVVAAL